MEFEEWLNRKEKPKEKKRYVLKKTRLKPVSSKQRKRLSLYEQAKKDHYRSDKNQACFICGSRDGLSIHHVKGRGQNLCNSFITLCLRGDYLDKKFPELNHNHTGGCHGFVEGNKKWARENGYIK